MGLSEPLPILAGVLTSLALRRSRTDNHSHRNFTWTIVLLFWKQFFRSSPSICGSYNLPPLSQWTMTLEGRECSLSIGVHLGLNTPQSLICTLISVNLCINQQPLQIGASGMQAEGCTRLWLQWWVLEGSLILCPFSQINGCRFSLRAYEILNCGFMAQFTVPGMNSTLWELAWNPIRAPWPTLGNLCLCCTKGYTVARPIVTVQLTTVQFARDKTIG